MLFVTPDFLPLDALWLLPAAVGIFGAIGRGLKAVGKGVGKAALKAAPYAGIAAAPFTGGTSLWATLAGAGGQAAGQIADTMAQNRAANMQATAFEDQARRNAMQDVAQSQYIQGAQGYTPREGMPTFGFGPRASSGTEIAAAAELEKTMMDRLKRGLPGAKPGFFEQFLGIASPIAKAAGDVWGPRPGQEG